MNVNFDSKNKLTDISLFQANNSFSIKNKHHFYQDSLATFSSSPHSSSLLSHVKYPFCILRGWVDNYLSSLIALKRTWRDVKQHVRVFLRLFILAVPPKDYQSTINYFERQLSYVEREGICNAIWKSTAAQHQDPKYGENQLRKNPVAPEVINGIKQFNTILQSQLIPLQKFEKSIRNPFISKEKILEEYQTLPDLSKHLIQEAAYQNRMKPSLCLSEAHLKLGEEIFKDNPKQLAIKIFLREKVFALTL